MAFDINSAKPVGFDLDSAKEVDETSLLEDIKISGVNALGTIQKADAGLRGALYSAFGDTEAADKAFQEREARGKKQEQWANPDNKQQSFLGKVAGTIITSPLQILSMPFSPFDTGQTMIDQGESLGKARAAGALDTAGNMAGVALPGALGKSLVQKMGSGFVINAAQDSAVRAAISGIADTEGAKKAFAPTMETAALSGIVGGAIGAVSKGGKPKAAPKTKPPVVDVDAVVRESKPVVESDVEYVKKGFEAKADDDQVRRLEAAIARQNPQQPDMRVTPDGQAYVSDAGAEAGRESARAITEAIDSVLRGEEAGFNSLRSQLAPIMEERLRSQFDQKLARNQDQADLLERAIAEQAQALIARRQAELEQGVATGQKESFFYDERARRVEADSQWRGQASQAPVLKLQEALEAARQASDEAAAAAKKAKTDAELIIAAKRQRDAQAVVEARQRALEEEMNRAGAFAQDARKRSEALAADAQWRAEKSQAPVPGLEAARVREIEDSIARTQDLNNSGQQMSIVEDYGNNDPMGRMPNMRVDENGMPIRADLSIEAQQLQNPLQRNLWGDELPVRTGDNGIPLTQALDKMPKGEARDAAVQSLSVGPKPPARMPASGRRGMGRSQSGKIDFKAIGEQLSRLRNAFGSKPDTVVHPQSETTITQKADTVNKLKALKEVLPEWAKTVGSFEEAVSEGSKAQDIKTSTTGQNVASGLNFMAAYHKNPILNYARSLFVDARGEASSASRQFITNKESGIGTLITKMTKEEKTVVSQLIHSLDKNQVAFTRTIGEKLGLSESAMKFMESMERIADFDFAWKKQILDAQGKTTPQKRVGYAPSVFSGSYVSAVLDKDGNHIGVIAADTPGEFMKAKEYFASKHPDAKYSANTWQQARKSISGNQNRGFVLRDTMAVLNLLSRVDGDIAKAHAEIELAIRKGANELWGMEGHEKAKKGLEGNQGNKPWLSKEANAQQRLDSLVRYYEEAFEYYSLQKPIEELNLLQKVDELGHLGNTFNYLDNYLGNVLGRRLSGPGQAANWMFDNGHKLLENVAAKLPYAKDIVGPGQTLKAANIAKNKMSHLFMGLGNYTFTLSQWMQPMQTGAPYMELVANRLGVDVDGAFKSMVKGGQDFLALKRGKELSPELRAASAYGESRGIFDFTELERAYEGHKSEFGRKWDNIAEWNMQIGESLTRPPMFLGFVRLLLDAGYDIREALPAAENLTNQAMVDYHPYERPMMYGGMGVLGQHAGGLTTFKHNFLGSQVLLGKEAAKPGVRSKMPMALSGMAMMALAGVTGIPAYQELDYLYQEAREMLTKERRSISQDMMANLPQWVKSGVLSDQLGLNMQGKFSAANMIPDSVPEALFPHLSGAGDIISSAYEAAKNPNKVTGANLAMAATPSGFKRLTEAAVRKDEDGNVINKKGQVEVARSEEDWKRAMMSGSLVPNGEAAARQELYQDRVNEASKREQMKSLNEKFEMAVLTQDDETMLEILNKYEDLTGLPPTKLIEKIPQLQMEAAKTAKERAEGIPKTLEGMKRYDAYN